jgi:hypothetical protein
MPGSNDDAPELLAFLSARDVPCPRCLYNLRDARSPACPECGARLDLRIGSDDLRLGPWVTALIGASLSLGFLVVVSFLAAVTALLGEFEDARDWMAAVVCWIFTAYLAAVVWFLVRRRHAFLGGRVWLQWIMAVAAAVFGVTLIGAFVWLFVGLVGS